jgi:mRNA interferase MazF
MVIRQGDVFWLERLGAVGSEISKRRPFVVIQNDVYNASRIGTVLVCALTSSMKQSQVPTNVLLDEGEANLNKRSVVNVSQMMNVDRSRLVARVGSLSSRRIRQVVDGIVRMIEPTELPEIEPEANCGTSNS